MKDRSKKRASTQEYISGNQLTIEGFETPFSRELDPTNRWVVLANKIPWDDLASLYLKKNKVKSTGRPPLNPRLVIGALIIKHLCNLDDRETVTQVSENMYMQYFLGYSAFSTDPPFDPSLFVEIRKRVGDELIGEINDRILELDGKKKASLKGQKKDDQDPPAPTHQGELLIDATVAPQNIAYPTDLNLLNESREISENIIDHLHTRGEPKPRTYRKEARKSYLSVAQNRNPSNKTIRKAVGKQLRYLRRNFNHINSMLEEFEQIPLPKNLLKQYWVIQVVYDQQLDMYENKKRSVSDRIVSIHQPHVRPIVRGKSRSKTEFGAKIHVSLVEGYAFLDTISWDAYNEGNRLEEYVENYKNRFGFYPAKVLADKLYCTRANRSWLKERGIKLAAKPLGRPSKKAVANHVRPGERNPIEGKFGQAKTGYGLNCIKARLRDTSRSWIASIIMVLNLVKLAGQVPYCLVKMSFSAWYKSKALTKHAIERIQIKPNLENTSRFGFSAFSIPSF